MLGRNWLLLVCLALSWGGCHLSHLAQGQYRVLSESISVGSALRDPSLTAADREKILLVQEVRRYAEAKMWLDPTDNYTTYLPGPKRPPMHMLTVARRDRLEPHWWRYPFFGRSSYREYFNEQMARRDERLWQARGYDTYVSAASAYSTCGWFTDPIMSNMLDWEDERLIATVLHELTHATVISRHRTDFTESAAEFVSQAGAVDFVAWRYGADSPQMTRLLDMFHDERLHDAFFRDLAARAAATYAEEPTDLEQARRELFSEADMAYARYRERFRSPSYRRSQLGEINNAILILRVNYGSTEPFREAFAAVRGDWRKFIKLLKKSAKKRQPFERLRQLQYSAQ